MNPRFLLDTHIVVRWYAVPKKLSRDQIRVLNDAERSGECLGISAISLIEIVTLAESERIRVRLNEVFDELDNNPMWRIVPVTTDVAREVAAIGDSLRDPVDRAIVATARVNRLRLLTSDQRIIDSGLVSTIE